MKPLCLLSFRKFIFNKPNLHNRFICSRLYSINLPPPENEANQNNKELVALCREGETLLDCAHNNDIELEGACEGSLACSTCHVILQDEIYKNLSEPTDEENDMLDLAFGLTETSRLGCQIKITKQMQGMKVKLPAATRNMAVDGYKPKPH